MGLGKTVQLLALLLAEREQPSNGSGKRRRKRLAPTLLVCPMSVAGNWQREAERFAPSLRVHVHHGRERLAGEEFARAAQASDLVITTYALATARPRDARRRRVGAGRARRGAEHQDDRREADARDPLAAGPPPRRAHRHAGREPPRRADSIMDFLNPGLLGPADGVQAALRAADRALARRARDRAPAAGDRPLHPAPPEDRQGDHRRPAREDRDARRLPSDQGAGDPLPGGRRRDAREGGRAPRGSSARGSSSRR